MPVNIQNLVPAPTGANTLTNVAQLTPGSTLKFVTVTSEGVSTGPFFLSFGLRTGGATFGLQSGVGRQDADGNIDSVKWFGSIEVPEDDRQYMIRVAADNRTGTTGTCVVVWGWDE